MKIFLFISIFICSELYSQIPDEFVHDPTNSSGTIIGQIQINGFSASNDDWIAAFDESGNCCGASQLIMSDGISYMNLAIYGDDATTSQVDEGIDNGEGFTLKLFDYSSNSILDYIVNEEVFFLENWSNTNGAPIAAYSNPNDIYQFSTVALEFNQVISICENEDPIILNGGFPEGGVYSGNGVVGNLFYPNMSESGIHEITYTLENNTISINAVVHNIETVEILSEGPYCSNDAAILLTSSIDGGIFYGDGIINNYLKPQLLNPGTYLMNYEVTDSNQCELSNEKYFTILQSPEVNILNNDNILFADIISGDVNDYFWNTGENSDMIIPKFEGEYWLIASNDECKSDTSYYNFYITSIIGESSDFNIFYDNIGNKLDVKLSNNFQVHLEIYSLNGKLLLNEFFKEKDFSIKINFKGLFLAKLSSKEKITTKILSSY